MADAGILESIMAAVALYGGEAGAAGGNGGTGRCIILYQA
jgi:hypothetical protein